jgi:hypothetical protein
MLEASQVPASSSMTYASCVDPTMYPLQDMASSVNPQFPRRIALIIDKWRSWSNLTDSNVEASSHWHSSHDEEGPSSDRIGDFLVSQLRSASKRRKEDEVATRRKVACWSSWPPPGKWFGIKTTLDILAVLDAAEWGLSARKIYYNE